jgi:hypothetical protein
MQALKTAGRCALTPPCFPISTSTARDRDLGGYVADARKAVASQVKFPPGYYVTWSGQFEYLSAPRHGSSSWCR